MSGLASANTELFKLEPSALLDLFELDLSIFDAASVYFHAGTNGIYTSIIFRGIHYQPMPVEISGFEYNGKGEFPRPKIAFSNILGEMTSLCLMYSDLVGAKLIRHRTFAKFIDRENFSPAVNATADINAELPVDVFYFNQKTREDNTIVEFELGTSLDVEDVKLPKRQVLSHICGWKYRGEGCEFAARSVVADEADAYLGNDATYRGEWADGPTYQQGDIVSYRGVLYVADVGGMRIAPGNYTFRGGQITAGNIALPYYLGGANYRRAFGEILMGGVRFFGDFETFGTYWTTLGTTIMKVSDLIRYHRRLYVCMVTTLELAPGGTLSTWASIVNNFNIFFPWRQISSRQPFTPNTYYLRGDSVMYGDPLLDISTYQEYRCILDVDTTSTPASPPNNTSNWAPTQLYRKNWDAAVTYAAGDVVYLTYGNSPIFHFYIAIAASTNQKPPNSTYWTADRCSKRVSGCRLRFDPTGTRSTPLRFGGFPGVAYIPQI